MGLDRWSRNAGLVILRLPEFKERSDGTEINRNAPDSDIDYVATISLAFGDWDYRQAVHGDWCISALYVSTVSVYVWFWEVNRHLGSFERIQNGWRYNCRCSAHFQYPTKTGSLEAEERVLFTYLAGRRKVSRMGGNAASSCIQTILGSILL